MTVKVQVLRSSTASKRPTSTALLDGELALNTNAGTAGIFFEDAGGTIRKVGPAEVGGTAPNASPASGGSAGNSEGEFWYDTANSGGNGQDVLKVYNGSTWHGPGDVTIGSTNIGVGDAATTAIAGLTSLGSGTLTASTGVTAENQGYIQFNEQSGNGSNYIRLVAPDAVTNNTVFKLPDGDGSNENVLITDGSGNLSWAAPAGTTVETQDSGNANSTHYITFVQDNNSNGNPQDEVVYTDASLQYNPGTNVLSINATTVASSLSTAALTLDSVLITATGTELNILDGATVTATELNILDGATLTTAELNYVDGVTSAIQGQLDAKGTLANQNALINLSGVSAGSTTLGSFTGSTITDNVAIKAALQELETAVESTAGGSATIATVTDSADATRFLTFVDDDNGSAAQESVKTDAGISYNPSTNVLSVSGSVAADVTGDVTGDLTGTADKANKVSVVKNETSGTYYFTFVDSNNTGAAYESLYTDTALNLNPSTNIVSGGGMDMVAYFINSVQITATASELNILDGCTASTNELNILDGVTATTLELNYTDGVTSNIQTQLDAKGTLTNQNALVTLSGVAAGATTLGTFSGSTISDNDSIKDALQSLETAVETATGGGAVAATVATVTDSTDATRYITFVDDDNSSATQEQIKTDAGVTFNPSTNVLTVGGSVAANVTGDVTGDLTGNADTASQVKTQTGSGNSVHYLTFVANNNGGASAETVYTDAGVYYNPFTNQFSANGVNTGVLSINTVDVTATATELNLLDGVTATTNELNILDGVTATTTELNLLDGVTATTTELNYVDGVTSNIQTQLDAKQATVSGGNGIAVSGSSIAVDLSAAAGDGLTVSGYTSPQSFTNGTYTIFSGFSGTISGTAGTSTMTFATNSDYNVYRDSVDSKVIAYNTTESSWMIAYAPSGIGSPSNGSTFTVSTQAYDLPTSSSVTKSGKNSPDASSWSEGAYDTGVEPFLGFTSGELHCLVKDEDDFASNSATHLATQQSIKAYVDAIDTDRIIDGDTNVTVDGTNDVISMTTGGTARWVIGANGNIAPAADATYDIGVSGNTVRNIVATNLTGTLQTASQTNVTGVGTLTAGTWNATAIGAQYGGTGLNGASAANGTLLIGNGSGYTLATLTEGQSTTITNAGGSITIAADLASAAGSSATANAGVASFSNAQFAVDSNGYVTHAGGFGLSSITADSGSASPSGNGVTLAGGTGITSSGSGASLTLTLDDTAVTAASYGSASAVPSFTVDAQGRLTAAADVSISILHTAVSDFDAGVQTNRLDQMATPTSAIAMGAQKITGLADPTADQDAATKKYVDDTAQGLNTKASVEVATTAALGSYTYNNGTSGVGATITMDSNGVVTIDGGTLVAGERVLIKDEAGANLPYNGIYTVTTVGTASAALVLTRAADQDENDEFAGAYVFVESGSVNDNNGYVCTAEDPFTVGTTDVTWEQFSGAGQVEAGDGLTKSGNTLNVGGTANRISVAANAVDIASTYVGQTSLTTLGTITTGTWNGTVLGLTYGGTGVDNTSITARHALIGPTSGTGNATFRALVADDIASGEFDAGTY